MAYDYVIPQDSSGNFNTGTPLPLDSLPSTLVFSGGFISTITVQYFGETYVQTFTNDGTDITDISGWVQQ